MDGVFEEDKVLTEQVDEVKGETVTWPKGRKQGRPCHVLKTTYLYVCGAPTALGNGRSHNRESLCSHKDSIVVMNQGKRRR